MTKRIFLSPPHMQEYDKRLLSQAFDSNWVAPLGPDVDAFERELAAKIASPHAVALSSGTAALHLAMTLVGVQPGDEVWVPSLTFIASIGPAVHLGARPVFFDVCPKTWTLDADLLEAELMRAHRANRLPRAIITVDLYGQCADYPRIRALADRFEIPVIQDAAEALGSTAYGRAAGTWGHLGVFSFNGNKIITTSGGGMLVSERREWIDQARFLSAQARDSAAHYQHSRVGFNYRLSNLLAAVGRGQLSVLDERVQARQRVNRFYQEALSNTAGITFQQQADGTRSNRWLTAIQIDPNLFGASQETIRLALEQRSIEARPVWKPLHLQPVFSECRFVGSGICEVLFERGLCLPSGSALTAVELAEICTCIRRCATERT